MMMNRYSNISTETNARTVRTSDGRGTLRVLVLRTNAQGQLATCIRMDGQGTGSPFVVRASEFVAEVR